MEFEDINEEEILQIVEEVERQRSMVGLNISEDFQTVNMDSDGMVNNDVSSVDMFGPTMEQVRDFCNQQKKVNTTKATSRDIKTFSDWLAKNKFEMRSIESIPPLELNQYMAQFFVFIRKQDGSEYQPSTLTNMMYSFDRYLKDAKYYTLEDRIDILKHVMFDDARLALQSKRQELRKQGLGNRPKRAVGIEDEEEEVLWQKRVLGRRTPFSLQFTVWYNLTLLMGLRGRDEHRNMRFGDVNMKKDASDIEYLEFTERNSKTRDGSMLDDHRQTVPKVFCSCAYGGEERCVVEIWKEYCQRRPDNYCDKDHPLYLQAKSESQLKSSGSNIWFKAQPLGVASLGKFLPNACLMAGLPPRGNHGVRATTVRRLREASVADDKIIQVTGHRSVRTLAVYDTEKLSTKEHQNVQCILQRKPSSSVSTPTTALSVASNVETHVGSLSQDVVPLSNVANKMANQAQGQGSNSIFSGAVFNNCVFTINASKNADGKND